MVRGKGAPRRGVTAGLRRRDEAKALFRNAILEAAEEVFATEGFHAARMKDIADRARIAVGTIYNHFEEKDDVLYALIEERTAEMLRALSPAADDPTAFHERLTVRLTRFLEFVRTRQRFYQLAVEHGIFGGATAAASQLLGKRRVPRMDRLKAELRHLVEDGVGAGAIAEADRAIAYRFLGTTLRAVSLQALDDPSLTPAAAAALTVRLFLHGAGAPREVRRSASRSRS